MSYVRNRIFILAIFSSVLLFGIQASAATLSISGGDVRVDDEVEVVLTLDASDTAINALEGILLFPENLKVKEIHEHNSFVSLWIEPPHVAASGEIRFSGVIPGGYTGEDMPIFSIIFTAVREGVATLDVRGLRALKSDGLGTPLSLAISRGEVVISPQGEAAERVTTDVDRVPPESFSPEVGRSEHVFDGEYFVVFTTHDKGSGIASYAVYESKWNSLWVPGGRWKEVESPYRLQDQSLQSYIHVRAVDHAGNTRTEMIAPVGSILSSFGYALTLLLIAIVFTCGAILLSKRFRRIFPRAKL